MNKKIIDLIDQAVTIGKNLGIGHLYTEDEYYNGRTITIDGKELINFGSCSYLGLELDQRLKDGAIDAINRYGIQFSSSRSYVSCGLYAELEKLIEQIFGGPVIIAPTTTLAHQATIPVIVEEGDAIIIDQQAHASLQDVAFKIQLRNIPVIISRHNDLGDLRKKIEELQQKHNRIWYMADGIYSMYGDYAPIDALVNMLDEYKKLYAYIDDAHGISWIGKHGTGYVLSKTKNLHSKMIVAGSFAKAFGTGGGIVVFPNEQWRSKVRNCGGPLIFSGPIQIPVLGASIASAKIHLSNELEALQKELQEKTQYCNDILLQHQLPIISAPNTPIFFVGLGLRKIGDQAVKRIINDGFYVNLSMFPAVSETCTGIRFTITRHHQEEDIDRLVSSIAKHLPQVLQEEARSMSDIQRAFRNVKQFSLNINQSSIDINKALMIKANPYQIQHENSIQNIPMALWDGLFKNDVSYDWKGLLHLEQLFNNEKYQEHNWKFHYYIIRDQYNQPVLATYFTSVLTKDDMLYPAHISKEIEWTRLNDPYYLCSTSLLMGTQLSTGKHLYIDHTRKDWKSLMMTLLDETWKLQEKENANSLNYRDFDVKDTVMEDFFINNGFIKAELPSSLIINDIHIGNSNSYLQSLKHDKRHYIKNKVINYADHFTTRIVEEPSIEEAEHYHQLYKKVANRNFDINVFHLPVSLFEQTANHPQWEVIEINLKSEYDQREKPLPVAMALCYKTAYHYYFVLAGLDYTYVEQYNVYAQLLWQIVQRANALGLKKIDLGITTAQNKRKFGAIEHPHVAYVQIEDKYNLSVIDNVMHKHIGLVKV